MVSTRMIFYVKRGTRATCREEIFLSFFVSLLLITYTEDACARAQPYVSVPVSCVCVCEYVCMCATAYAWELQHYNVNMSDGTHVAPAYQCGRTFRAGMSYVWSVTCMYVGCVRTPSSWITIIARKYRATTWAIIQKYIKKNPFEVHNKFYCGHNWWIRCTHLLVWIRPI